MKLTFDRRRKLGLVSILGLVLIPLALHASSGIATPVGTTSPASAATARESSVEVLWDLTHGIYFGYEPTTLYQLLSTLLADRGYTITTTAAGIDIVDLTPYSVLVLCLGSAWDSAYTAPEVAAVLGFMAQGKGVLVLADGGGTPSANLNPITNEAGIACGNPIGEDNLDVVDFEPHPIFTGIGSIYMRAAGWLEVVSPGIVLAREPGGLPVVAALPDCRMIVVGDINFCENVYIAHADNQQFAINLFDALESDDCTVPVQHATWGKVKAIYR